VLLLLLLLLLMAPTLLSNDAETATVPISAIPVL
jgi:hypothetical protein